MRKSNQYILKKIDTQFVLIPYKENALEKKEVISLSESATIMYNESEKANSIEELAQRVADIYNVNIDVVLEDVKQTIATFVENGVLILS